MNRLTLVAAVSVAICNCFVVSAFAQGNDNDPHMQMFSSDGSLGWHDGSIEWLDLYRKKTVPEQIKEKRMDGTGPDGAAKKGPDGRKIPGKSRDRY